MTRTEYVWGNRKPKVTQVRVTKCVGGGRRRKSKASWKDKGRGFESGQRKGVISYIGRDNKALPNPLSERGTNFDREAWRESVK